MVSFKRQSVAVTITVFLLVASLWAQQASTPASTPPRPPNFNRTPFDTVVSPEFSSDGHITFRFYAPQAKSVNVSGEWLTPEESQKGVDLQAGDNGIWSVTLGPLLPGAYRYRFMVDGARVMDPRNPNTSQSLQVPQSMFVVPGDYSETKDVPHGTVSVVWYQSKSLNQWRRMHVYTPPGYEKDQQRYPVFYLLHGAGDSDESWTSVGRAGFIVDNLIADHQAKPMIIVMPAGHVTSAMPSMNRGPNAFNTGEFEKDFLQDVMPYVESHYRVVADRSHRAIAGLSMGGLQTLNISMTNLNKFSAVGVFSSGWFTQEMRDNFEKQHGAELDDASAKKGLRNVWFSTGKKDFLLDQSKATVELLKKHNFNVEFQESEGYHAWNNWRDYLHKFAPLLFQ